MVLLLVVGGCSLVLATERALGLAEDSTIPIFAKRVVGQTLNLQDYWLIDSLA